MAGQGRGGYMPRGGGRRRRKGAEEGEVGYDSAGGRSKAAGGGE